jgi:hypothetical protein
MQGVRHKMTENEYLDKLFIDAGWYEGRFVAVDKDIASKDAIQNKAIGVLSEYSGLHVGTVGAGRDCAASDNDTHIL